MEQLYTVIIGSVLLSLVHALIPNHWLPIVAIAKTEGWNKMETLWVTTITGFAHTASTILLGAFFGWASYEVSRTYDVFSSVVAPAILVLLGLWYIFRSLQNKGHHHHSFKSESGSSKFAIILSLSLAMFLSPCLELQVYYINVGQHGWTGILTVSAIYLFVTVATMVLLVALAERLLTWINWHFLEHHERLVTGILLVALGIFSLGFEILGHGHGH